MPDRMETVSANAWITYTSYVIKLQFFKKNIYFFVLFYFHFLPIPILALIINVCYLIR